MLSVERRLFILNLIQERGSITVSELSQLCNVGEETIRRDLNRMAAENLIEKIYGGATIRQNMHRVLPVSMRKVLNSEGKKLIAEHCSQMVKDGDTIFLDASSTAMEIAGKLNTFNNLVVITNATDIAAGLADNPGIKVIGIGGTMRSRTRSFVGHSSVTSIGEYYADMAFIGCDGVDMRTGITDANEQEADVRKAMLKQSITGVLISDYSKFDRTSFASIAGFSHINKIVTDQPLSEEWINFLNNENVQCTICRDIKDKQ